MLPEWGPRVSTLDSFILLFVPVLSSVILLKYCENLASPASMSACAVATCPNHHRRTKGKGVMYHMFPVCPNRIKIWISTCKRHDHINVKYARICSDHFRPSDYVDDMENRLLGLNQKKILKPDAVPSVNLPLQDNGEDISSRSERKRSILREAKIRLKCLSPKKACEANSFMMKKKWNLYGPDRNIKYWPVLRKEPSSFFSRQSGGGSMMVWAAFGFKGKVALAFLDGRQNSSKYIEILENHLMPFAENISGGNWEYQHDNAPIHTSNATKNYLNSKNVTVLKWPPMSPELNPIENVWCIMSRQLYENGGQFYSVNALKAAIESAWYNLEPEILQTLNMSLEKRVYDVILNNGKILKY
ncbi:Transposable element Tc3 transposase [Araneus ventricosus]|uniref:Transposable element Tc3 transposase n=1 Tax=Araneus ventricosus TaxID=182803 RepID=A0A4Y2FLQ9_ARAVE|nr:Transposable element Tc3 transposase [Araneus ventricosus]